MTAQFFQSLSYPLYIYTYNGVDLVTKINYNDAKRASYRYNATGNLVSMEGWLGTTTFELDPLHQLTAATDHRGDRVKYTYDGLGALMGQTWIIAKNGYGYHNGQSDDVTSEEPAAPATEPELELENAVVQYSGQPDKGNNYVYSDKAV